MAGEAKHECAIAGIYLPKNPNQYPEGGASYYLYKMLLAQQNRGQLSAGITTFNKKRKILLRSYKKLGTVNEAFRYKEPQRMQNIFREMAGPKGIGHVRYSTCGGDSKEYAQPFNRYHGRTWKWFSLAFNGNIANYVELKKELEQQQYHLTLDVDTELIQHFLSKAFIGDKPRDLDDAWASVSEKLDGAYAVCFLNAKGEMFAARSPYGIKPLCYASNDDFTAFASESGGLPRGDENGTRDVKAGEMLLVSDGNVEVKRFQKNPRNAHCMFEYVYFANASSTLDGRSVYLARRRLGEELAKIEPFKVNDREWVVVGVPDTAKPVADAFGQALNVPSMEGLLRNRYVGRTFIESSNRLERVKEKYTVLKQVVKDKKVLLVEDSVVRGTTSKALLQYIRDAGQPREIHVRVACPPIVAPCFYGIDMSTLGELMAPKHMEEGEVQEGIGEKDVSAETVEKIRKEITADSLVYLTKKGLVKAIDLPNGASDLCMACISARYPTPHGQNLYFKAFERMKEGKTGRTYQDSC